MYHNQTVQGKGASGDSPKACNLDLFWGSRFPRKGWKPCGRPLGGSVALLEETSPCAQLRPVLSRHSHPLPPWSCPSSGLSETLTPTDPEGQGLGSLETSEKLPWGVQWTPACPRPQTLHTLGTCWGHFHTIGSGLCSSLPSGRPPGDVPGHQHFIPHDKPPAPGPTAAPCPLSVLLGVPSSTVIS